MRKPIQNLIDKEFTAEQLAQLDAALETIERLLADILVPDPTEKNRSAKPPEGAGNWETKMRTMARRYPGKLPGEFSLEAVQRDVNLSAELKEREVRVRAILDRIRAGSFKAGSDVFSACLKIRGALLEGGVPDVDHDLDEGMRDYFRRTKTAPAPPANGQG